MKTYSYMLSTGSQQALRDFEVSNKINCFDFRFVMFSMFSVAVFSTSTDEREEAGEEARGSLFVRVAMAGD